MSEGKPRDDGRPDAPGAYGAGRTAVHEQRIDGFGTVRLLRLDPVADAGTVHRWVREERAVFWGMNGLTEEQVGEVYAHLDTLDTHHAFLAVKDGEPVGLLQTYEPEADRVSECYAVEPGDLGIHVLLAPPGETAPGTGGVRAGGVETDAAGRAGAGPGGRRPGWSRALMSVFTTYAFTVLGRARIVVDPDARNARALARFTAEGFVLGPPVTLPEIDLPDVYLPEKRARLGFLRAADGEGVRDGRAR
jgi:hypothetical protein